MKTPRRTEHKLLFPFLVLAFILGLIWYLPGNLFFLAVLAGVVFIIWESIHNSGGGSRGDG